ncbi:glycosyltransferase family protein [Acetobacterium woodii]|uniref:Glycosyltransferase n=1 Tax=Acetobacterium woodii (strain ATCC 29683 / DSM 1030 / JCM 2381 / KCTC 1655 / WB1) TaxID=931626 RepID=H6LEL5_ACEWD|nr:hypothetical protein [Acetobacterium woodii]AFA48118.1 hypothetical protein Awo_c13340 [Acetobacterium woodii DSM 1030]
MIWIKKQTINPEVTDYYLEIIGEAYSRLGEKVEYFTDWNDCRAIKKDIIVVTRYKEVLKMILQRRRYIYWIQGILPEENYALYHSKLKVFIYNIIERIMFNYTNNHNYLFIMVSNRMKKHYEDKYSKQINNCYIMPCNNDSIHKESFFEEGKYNEDVFCYAGGLNVWQCIDETLNIYKHIETENPKAKLLLLVKDHNLAKELVDKYGIRNYEFDFVPVDKLPDKLKKVKYGFIVREDLELNRVATPTKLMTYMGNGVISILSECLEGLTENLDETKYIIKLKNVHDFDSIKCAMSETVDAQEIYNDYKRIYKNHYDGKTHINRMKDALPR